MRWRLSDTKVDVQKSTTRHEPGNQIPPIVHELVELGEEDGFRPGWTHSAVAIEPDMQGIHPAVLGWQFEDGTGRRPDPLVYV
ncbi:MULTISPECIES: hypothetical protein [Streptomyces]|uniref:hypothetical protein n=1 Tax=Streptomyces TaxID=1883 RepID=UPI003662566D